MPGVPNATAMPTRWIPALFAAVMTPKRGRKRSAAAGLELRTAIDATTGDAVRHFAIQRGTPGCGYGTSVTRLVNDGPTVNNAGSLDHS
jgi:hypothetical protein